MTTGRHEPGRSFAGKGLFSNFQRRLLRLNCTLVTLRVHSPVLQIDSVRSAQHPAFTPPNVVEPATVSLPAGASPETLMLVGLAGSSLVTVIVAAFAPKPSGLNRIGTGRASPGPIVIG